MEKEKNKVVVRIKQKGLAYTAIGVSQVIAFYILLFASISVGELKIALPAVIACGTLIAYLEIRRKELVSKVQAK